MYTLEANAFLLSLCLGTRAVSSINDSVQHVSVTSSCGHVLLLWRIQERAVLAVVADAKAPRPSYFPHIEEALEIIEQGMLRIDEWIEQGNPKKTWTFFVHAVLCSCVMLCNARLCNVMLCQVVLVSSPYGCLLNTYFFTRCRVLLFSLNLYICLSSYLQSTSCM
jgi:hypothetical protein